MHGKPVVILLLYYFWNRVSGCTYFGHTHLKETLTENLTGIYCTPTVVTRRFTLLNNRRKQEKFCGVTQMLLCKSGGQLGQYKFINWRHFVHIR